jgi:hypothetical protein
MQPAPKKRLDCLVVKNEDGKVLRRFRSVLEAEDYIARILLPVDPDGVNAGAYGIDAPEEKINPRKV